MLAIELIQLSFGSIGFPSVAVWNEADIHDARNRLKGSPQLCTDEFSAVRTQGFVVESEIHPIILILDVPHIAFTLLGHLFRERPQ